MDFSFINISDLDLKTSRPGNIITFCGKDQAYYRETTETTLQVGHVSQQLSASCQLLSIMQTGMVACTFVSSLKQECQARWTHAAILV